MNNNNEKNKLVLADVIAKAWNDAAFKKQLIADPKLALTSMGMQGIADIANVSVLENTQTKKYIALPAAGKTADIAKNMDGYFRKILPLPAGLELAFVQNSTNTIYIVLPLPPPLNNVKFDASHTQVLTAAGWESAAANLQAVVVQSVDTNVNTFAIDNVFVVIDNAVIVSAATVNSSVNVVIV